MPYIIRANKSLKKSLKGGRGVGAQVGITLIPHARTKFFLIVPELSLVAEEAKEMAGTTLGKDDTHYQTLSTSVISREEANI